MKDEDNTKDQLINELAELRQELKEICKSKTLDQNIKKSK